jgi:hypothetical protein
MNTVQHEPSPSGVANDRRFLTSRNNEPFALFFSKPKLLHLKVMHKTIIAAALFALPLLGNLPESHATIVGGLELEIGDSNDVSPIGGAIGSFNTVNGFGSIAVGDYNVVSGSYNSAFGSQNSVDGFELMTIGFTNTLALTLGATPSQSLVVGYFNGMNGGVSGSIVSGISNSVSGDIVGGTMSTLEASATFGMGLRNKWNYATVIGRFNSNTPPSSLLFAIGNGTDQNHRSNAVEVYTDGKVIIRRVQGDILMGEFGN